MADDERRIARGLLPPHAVVAVEDGKGDAEARRIGRHIVQKRHGIAPARTGDAYFFARIAPEVDFHVTIISHHAAICNDKKIIITNFLQCRKKIVDK